jgi:hypothetical protein
MFITLQLPFVDLRPFLKYPLKIVPERRMTLKPELTDLERIAKDEYLRCFGHYRVRNYIPKFKAGGKKYKYKDDQWAKLGKIWQDEYLYASARRGLRFESLEKQVLLGGKLINPRAKVRALRSFPFSPVKNNNLWSPCMRIETGISYDVTEPLLADEMIAALIEFMKMKVNVPVYKKGGSDKNDSTLPKLRRDTIIAQQKTLAQLIVKGTTAHVELRVSGDMISPGDPIFSVHYTKNEISSLPKNTIHLPKSSTGGVQISFLPLKNPRIGIWLFQLPKTRMKGEIKAKMIESIRNNTIAIMRYWSEFQAVIGLRNAIAADRFEFDLKKDKLMMTYLSRATKFLLSGSWNGLSLEIIRKNINAYQLADPLNQESSNKIIKEFPRQLAKKILQVGLNKPGIFVSYSHIDQVYLPIIKGAFKTLNKTHEIEYFDDTVIGGGTEWEPKIINALENTTIAVLLMSAGFLNSNYITTREIPVIADRYKRGMLNIIPVLIDGKVPVDPFLSRLQFINANYPLKGCSKEKTKEIMSLVIKAVHSF